MTVRAWSGWRRAVARGAMLGLVFQALLGAFMLPMPYAVTSVAAASTAWTSAICVPKGVKQAGDGAGQTGPGSGQPAGACAVCAVLAVSSFALVPVLQPLPHEPPALITAQPGADRRPPRAAVLAWHNRGPPLQA
jgi:hypothetical protein